MIPDIFQIIRLVFVLTGLELRPLGRPARSQSLSSNKRKNFEACTSETKTRWIKEWVTFSLFAVYFPSKQLHNNNKFYFPCKQLHVSYKFAQGSVMPPIYQDGCELFRQLPSFWESRDSAVGIQTGYGLDDRGVGVESRKCQGFSLLHVVQASSGAHPASYPMGIGGSFTGG
jgi:hypothetical protein